MREIKFRAKDKFTGKWVYGDLLHVEDGIIICNEIGNYEIDVKTIGQYTGLKDKNGKKIYEEDILQPKNKAKQYYQVIWDKDSWKRGHKFIQKYEGEQWVETNNLPMYADSHIVVGNIFDNAELLEGKP